MRETGNGIASGDIAASPLDGRDSPACKYCDYSAVCGREGAPRQLGWYRAILRPDIRGAFILPEKNHFKEAIKH